MFLAGRKPKTTVFTVFFAPGTKNHGIYSVLWPAPSKNTGIYAVFTILQDVLLPCKTHKNTVNYSVFAFTVFLRLKPDEIRQKPPTSVQNGASRSTRKTRQAAGRFLSSPPPGSGLTFQKRTDFGPPPPTPPRLASLRFAYTYTQAQAFGWLSWHVQYLELNRSSHKVQRDPNQQYIFCNINIQPPKKHSAGSFHVETFSRLPKG